MNLTDYFEPVDFPKITKGISSLGKYGLGPLIKKFSETLDEKSLGKTDVVLLGIPADNGKRQKKGAASPDAVRSALYRLASFENNLRLADLGNLKVTKSHKGTLLALRDITEYLRQMNIVIVVLGGSQELTIGISEAFNNNRFFWLSTIDSVLDIKKGTEIFSSKNYLSRLFKMFPDIFQFSLIGYQQHLSGTNLLSKIGNIDNHLRLGELRENITAAELILRNSHVLSFDMGALKYSEAPGTTQRNPNGLRGEEACQLSYYAGLSPSLNVFGLFEIIADKNNGITSALAAEITWYFLKGVSERKKSQIKTEYKVEIEGLDYPVVFKHEWELNRWWFNVKSITGEVLEIACSEEEYKKAAANEIPERWLRFIQKMDNLSK